jgi:putative ABC transport system permease protein
MALGATRYDVRMLVLRQVITSAGCGLAIGVLALGVSRIFASSVFVMKHPFDWIAYGGAISVVIITAAAAALVPSQRASSVDPAATLRSD